MSYRYCRIQTRNVCAERFSSRRATLPNEIFVAGDRTYAGPALRTLPVCVIERTDNELNNYTHAANYSRTLIIQHIWNYITTRLSNKT